MFEFVRQFVAQVGTNFRMLPLSKKVAVLGISAGTLLSIILQVVWSNRIEYQPLYYNLSQEDAGMIVGELKDQKIPYHLSSNGKPVMVPADREYDLRLDLASRGIPSGGVPIPLDRPGDGLGLFRPVANGDASPSARTALPPFRHRPPPFPETPEDDPGPRGSPQLRCCRSRGDETRSSPIHWLGA